MYGIIRILVVAETTIQAPFRVLKCVVCVEGVTHASIPTMERPTVLDMVVITINRILIGAVATCTTHPLFQVIKCAVRVEAVDLKYLASTQTSTRLRVKSTPNILKIADNMKTLTFEQTKCVVIVVADTHGTVHTQI